jgi:lipid-binding SYLF domain-containing protein
MKPVLYVGGAMLAAAVVVSAEVTKSERDRLTEAGIVLDEIRAAADKDIPEELWEKASCVAVIPSVKKAAFVVGGEYGKGVVSCRDGKEWSAPSFLMLQKGSVGFQVGGETIDLVLLVMNEHGMKRLLEDKVALGGEASVAAGPVGRDVRAMTDAQLKAEILSYSRAQGLFAGVNLTGGVLAPDKDNNRDLYGREVSAKDILVGKTVTTPSAAQRFMAALRRTIPPQARAGQ